jgi:hypothetical protein
MEDRRDRTVNQDWMETPSSGKADYSGRYPEAGDGELIGCKREDAHRCFMRTEMDCLVTGNFIFDKREQPPGKEAKNWKDEYGID